MTFDHCGHETPQIDLDVLTGLVRNLDSKKCCVEIGSWAGSSALAMVAGGAEKVHCVDIWEGNEAIYQAFAANVGDMLDSRIIPHIGFSTNIVVTWREPIDLLFIDADHSYEQVLQDITLWTPHVREGGIICGHDFTLAGVERAVKETGHYILGGWSMWWRIKA